MKKRFLTVVLTVLAMLTCIFCLVACGDEENNTGDISSEQRHTHNYTAVTTAPTCEEKGFTTYICECGDSYADSYVSSLGHNFTHYISDNNATCTANGTESANCNHAGCQDRDTRTIENSTLSHTYNKEVVENKYLKDEATCTRKATYYKSCVCGAIGTEIFEYGSMLSHTYNKEVVESKYLKDEATCTRKATYYKSCVCGAIGTETFEYGSMLSHTYNKEVVESKYLKDEATCTRKATYYKSCVCGAFGTEIFEYGEEIAHPSESEWCYNETHHWHNPICSCEIKVDFAEHSIEESGWCEICKHSIRSTEGVQYNISDDGTYAEVIGYTGASTKVKVANIYNDLPVTNICEDSFKDAIITTIVLPDSITSISSSAFYGCSNLTNIEIPNSVTTIGDYAFYGCTSFTSVTVPTSVVYIGNGAFQGCNKMKEITLPFVGASANVGEDWSSDLYDSVFGYIFGFTYKTGDFTTFPTVEGTVQQYYYWINNWGEYRVYYYYIPTSLTKVTITGTSEATTIWSFAFYNCKNLASITIGKEVKLIKDWAFDQCFGLVEVINKSPHITIEKGAENNGRIGLYAIAVHTGSSRVSTDSDGCVMYTYGDDKILVGYIGLEKDIILSSGITSINDSMFSNNYSSLTSITIPRSLTSVGKHAFYNCSSLTKVNYLGTLDQWVQISFNDIYANPIYYTKNIYINGSLVTEVVLTTATKISDYAFYNCNSLTSITISDKLTNIGEDAFYNCSGLAGVYIENLTAWCEIAFNNEKSNPLYYAKKLYLNNSLIRELIIPDNTTYISDYAFYNCGNLINVTFSTSSQLTHIGLYAFANCGALVHVTIGKNVTFIAAGAFYNCSSLQNIIFEDTDYWYSTTNSTNWEDQTDGTYCDMSYSKNNANNFKSSCSHYLYKL